MKVDEIRFDTGEPVQEPEKASEPAASDISRTPQGLVRTFTSQGLDALEEFRDGMTDLEESLYASGIVSEAGAFGVDDDALGQRIVVCLVAREGVESPEKALQQYCRQELSSYMVPSEYIWHDALPRNPNGKIDRATIARTLADREQESKA